MHLHLCAALFSTSTENWNLLTWFLVPRNWRNEVFDQFNNKRNNHMLCLVLSHVWTLNENCVRTTTYILNVHILGKNYTCLSWCCHEPCSMWNKSAFKMMLKFCKRAVFLSPFVNVAHSIRFHCMKTLHAQYVCYNFEWDKWNVLVQSSLKTVTFRIMFWFANSKNDSKNVVYLSIFEAQKWIWTWAIYNNNDNIFPV